MEYKPEVIANTVEFWGPRFGRKISNDEAERLIDNVVQLFQCLDEAGRLVDAETGVRI
jgi:hypothetical protein